LNPVSLATLYFGYLLVYAAVANHGRFATSPWAGVLGDAYPASGGVTKGPAGGEGELLV
jgi:hypothetical protein